MELHHQTPKPQLNEAIIVEGLLSVSHNLFGDPQLLKVLMAAKLAERTLALSISGPLHQVFRDETLDWNLDAIRELGVALHFEGFGTNTTIAELLTLKPTQLVLDPEVTQNVLRQERARETVRLAVALAESIDAKTLAKDVDDANQAALLTELNCSFLQGPHIASTFQAELYDTTAAAPNRKVPIA